MSMLPEVKSSSSDFGNVSILGCDVKIGIITVPGEAAQEVCDRLVKIGVKAIWNFAPVKLDVIDSVIVQNENMASSLAILSSKLKK